MEQNRFAHGASAGAAGDEYAPLLPNNAPGAPPPDEDEDEHAFASDAEEEAYWAGVADGIRQVGGTVPPRLAARAARERLLVQQHGQPEAAAPAGDILDFTPAPVAHRADGWTPQRQREFLEALADCGIIRQAAARVNMTEQSVSRLRRRADARSFDRACDAAMRIGARRIHSIAYERAIEGTVKRHYFHGELKAEERVYDNRLLIALIGKLPNFNEPDPGAAEVERNWEPWMEAIEGGREPPASPPPPSRFNDDPLESKVWEDEGELLTNAPPPAGFNHYEGGAPGDRCYERQLTEAEEQWWEEEGRDTAEEVERFGYISHHLGRRTFFPWGSEPSEPSSAAAAKLQKEPSEASEACDESRPGAADGSAPAEPDRRRGLAATSAVAEPQDDTCRTSKEAASQPRPFGLSLSKAAPSS